MPLNYSKWDNLELSDDSDIEGHPNVDKKSLIRWKQRDIHEKREVRKHRIAQLKADIECNVVLQPRLKQIVEDVEKQGPPHFSQLVEKFQRDPSPEKPPTNSPEQPTYDAMLLSLLQTVLGEAKKKGVEQKEDSEKLKEALVAGLKEHLGKMVKDQALLRKDLEEEEAEQKKKITSDDIHEGFDSHYVPPKPDPAPVKGIIPDTKGKKKAQEFETLNPKGVAAASDTFASSVPDDDTDDDGDDEDTELPKLTPALEEFSKLPVRGYQKSWEFIQAHRDVIVPGASDALLVAAFRAQGEGKDTYAKQCVHQSLLLQYCDKLGKDGVRVFFNKMVNADARAVAVFEKDVLDTYAHLVERVRVTKAEESAAHEQIQLVPENPNQSITFNIPDGPPPENITLEGPGFENVDINEVKKALQMRWDVFSAFQKDFQDALKSQNLDSVNKVLGKMKVEVAEEMVGLLDMAGILSFSDTNIRDETGQGDDDEFEEEDEEEDEEDKDA